jgi:tetratricopeptide (TPR) repeat protein
MKLNIDEKRSTGRMAVAVLLLFCCQLLSANSNEAAWYKQAAVHYKANSFEQTALLYEKILTQGSKSPEVYYNLGNCYYKLNNLGRAILNYERALQQSPTDEDVLHNLKLAEQKTVDRIVPVPQLGIVTWWQSFVTLQTSSGWRIFGALTIWLSLAAFVACLFTRAKKVFATTGSLLLLCTLVFVLLSFKQSQHEQYSNEAIVLVSSVNVKSAPDSNGNDIFTVHEGLKLKILDKVGQWNKIRLADGKTGWLESTSFSRI